MIDDENKSETLVERRKMLFDKINSYIPKEYVNIIKKNEQRYIIVLITKDNEKMFYAGYSFQLNKVFLFNPEKKLELFSLHADEFYITSSMDVKYSIIEDILYISLFLYETKENYKNLSIDKHELLKEIPQNLIYPFSYNLYTPIVNQSEDKSKIVFMLCDEVVRSKEYWVKYPEQLKEKVNKG